MLRFIINFSEHSQPQLEIIFTFCAFLLALAIEMLSLVSARSLGAVHKLRVIILFACFI